MLPEDAILLPEIVDEIFLVAIHPASQSQHEEVQSVGHGGGYMAQTRPSPTLSRGFTRLGRFLAPYGIDTVDPTYYTPGMAMGRRKHRARTPGLWIATNALPRTGGHPFYQRLNQVLDTHAFDEFVEAQCAPFYADAVGRPSLTPGTYFRLLLIGYFEGIDSERGIAAASNSTSFGQANPSKTHSLNRLTGAYETNV